jgi:hypothetical protein
MGEHMPGPWRAVYPDGSNGFWYVENAENKQACTCYGRDAEANARLIAVALELLEGAVGLEKWWRLPNHERTMESIEPIMREALNAIAKAEGQ